MPLRGLIELLSRCTIMQFAEDSRVYMLHRDDGKWFISTEWSPGEIIVHECRLSDDAIAQGFKPLRLDLGGDYYGI